MCKKVISEQRLNSILVNAKINDFLQSDSVLCSAKKDKHVRLSKLVLRNSPAPKIPTDVPVYAFVKNIGEKLACCELVSGNVVTLSPADIKSECNVKGHFRIGSVTYGIKDTVNGCPRYRALSTAPSKPRHNKIAINEVDE